jgi:hypothetical protein
MGFLRRLLGGDASAAAPVARPAPEVADDRQRLTVWVRLSDPALEGDRERIRVYGLEDRLMRAVEADGSGIFDTNELDNGYLGIRFLGADVDRIMAVVRPLIGDLPPGSFLAVRRGGEDASEERIEL